MGSGAACSLLQRVFALPLTVADTLKKQASQNASEYSRLADEHIKAVSSSLKHHGSRVSRLLTRSQTGATSDKKID